MEMETPQVQVQAQTPQVVKISIEDLTKLKEYVAEVRAQIEQLKRIQKKLARLADELKNRTFVLDRAIDLVKEIDDFLEEYQKVSKLYTAHRNMKLPTFWLEERAKDLLKEALLEKHLFGSDPAVNRAIRLGDRVLEAAARITSTLSRIYGILEFRGDADPSILDIL